MLEQKVTSRGAMVGELGFDAGAADRWRSSIGARERRVIERLLGSRLAEMGYRVGRRSAPRAGRGRAVAALVRP